MILSIILIIIIIFVYLKTRPKSEIECIFINEETKKYHRKDCPYAKGLKKLELNNAIMNGYIPCKICNKK